MSQIFWNNEGWPFVEGGDSRDGGSPALKANAPYFE
jgi:hypothetical protein